MLISFAIRNFQSFHEQAEISLALGEKAPKDSRTFAEKALGLRLTKALAVLGPNASGKTTLLKPLAFLDWFIKHSFRTQVGSPVPVTPHFCAPTEPSEFQVEFALEGKQWRYRLVTDSQRVYSESLHCRAARTYSYVFTRNWDPGKRKYAIKQRQFGMIQREAEKVRENASLIATAAQYEVPLAMRLQGARVFTNLDVLGRQHINDFHLTDATNRYFADESMRAQMAKLLSQWDLGLTDVQIVNQSVTTAEGDTTEMQIPFGVHSIRGQEHRLMMRMESSGTQGAYLLLSKVLPVLNAGGLVVIDELEADLHPHMLTPILDLFFSERTNPHNAQIIFTCHSIEVLSLLHKGQVVLVEKDTDGASLAWRLDSVKGLRSDDNLYAKYMAGAYGAIPQL